MGVALTDADRIRTDDTWLNEASALSRLSYRVQSARTAEWIEGFLSNKLQGQKIETEAQARARFIQVRRAG